MDSIKPVPMIWFEEYKTCSCSFLALEKKDLPGYCEKHGTEKRRRMRVPNHDYKDEDLGYAG
jgi:hypothetical protein